GIPLIAILQAGAAEMRGEMPLPHELGDHALVEARWLTVDQGSRIDERAGQSVRYHGVADPQARKERLVERTDINGALGVVQSLERGQGPPGIPEFARVVVF